MSPFAEWALSIWFSKKFWASEPVSVSLTQMDSFVLSCAWGRGTREEPLPSITPGILALSTTLALLVEKVRIIPTYRTEKQAYRTGQWGQLLALLTTVLEGPTPLNPFWNKVGQT